MSSHIKNQGPKSYLQSKLLLFIFFI